MSVRREERLARVRQPGGRPSEYLEAYAEQARKLCLLGATNEDLAKFFEVSTVTIGKWMKAHPAFVTAIKNGRETADAHVAERLYTRATGFVAPDTHVSVIEKEVVLTPIDKHYPPDTTAAIFWLKNRQREKWKDVHRVENTGANGEPLIPPSFSVSFDATPADKPAESDEPSGEPDKA